MFITIEQNKNIFYILRENKKLLNPIALYDTILGKYAMILGHYPMKESKYKIFSNLNRTERVGMLNRHILGVASKLGIYQTILKNIDELRLNHKKYKKYKNNTKKKSKKSLFSNSENDNFWQKKYIENQAKLTEQYNILLDIIIEEINKRNNPKYLRKKKLQEIKANLQN